MPRRIAADCGDQVRLDEVTYTGYGYTDRKPVPFAMAHKADCHDVGKDAPGLVFPDNPQQVEAWRFEGYSPKNVLAVPFRNDSYEVFIAESLPEAETDRILAELD
jgi:hypothetical protein